MFAEIVAVHLSPNFQRAETTSVQFALYGVQQRAAVQCHREVLDLDPGDPGFRSGLVTLKIQTSFLFTVLKQTKTNKQWEQYFLPFLLPRVEGTIK